MERGKELFAKLTTFESRETDWWILTLLPLIVFIPITVLLLFQGHGILEISFGFAQQLLAYSLVQSSTDLAIRSRSKRDGKSIGFPLTFMIVSAVVLAGLYLQQELVLSSLWVNVLFLIASLTLTYLSVRSYNHNPEGSLIGPEAVTEAKVQSEERAAKAFKAEAGDSLFNNIKWG